MRVLVAEDDSRLAGLLAQAVGEAGWTATVVGDGPSALAAALTGGHDVLLLDWMLPGLEGPEVVARLREEGYGTPVLLLTARGALADRVQGLDAGADDYLAKPFELDELLARLRALHRRATPTAVTAWRAGDLLVDPDAPLVPLHRPPTPTAVTAWRAGDLLVDPDARRVTRAGHEIALSAREFDVLALLVERAGQVVSRYAILDGVWDGETDISSNVIDVHIARLRAKIDTPFGRSAIQTLRGAGYRLDPAGG